MRIHRITLRNFRGVGDCTIEPRPVGVTIIEGDNEVGKSSLVEALDLLVNTKASAASRAVKAVQPAGRDVGAEVEAEIESGPYRFVYRKRWNKEKLTELTVLHPAREQLTGDDAHDRVQEILAATMDLQLWNALRVSQGGTLSQGSFGALREGSLGAALDVAAHGDLAGDSEESLWERITAERDRYWTTTFQKSKERKDLDVAIANEQEHLDHAEAQLKSLESDAEEVRSLGESVKSLEASLEQAEKDLDALSTRAKDARAILRNLEIASGKRLNASLELQLRQHEHDDRLEAARRVADARSALGQLEQTKTDGGPSLDEVAGEVDGTEARVRQAEDELSAAEDELKAATGSRGLLDDVVHLQQWTERCERAVKASSDLREAEKELMGRRVDSAALQALEEAHLAVVKAEAAEQGAGTLAIEALATVDIVVDGEPTSLEKGSELKSASADMQVEIPGVVRVQFQASSVGRGLAGGRLKAQSQLDDLLRSAGVADIVEARQSNQRRIDVEKDISFARRQIKENLNDLTLEDLEEKVSTVRESISARGIDPDLPDTDVSHAAAVAADEAVEKAEGALASARSRHREAVDAAAVARARADVVGAEIRGIEERISSARESLGELESALEESRSSRSDEQIAADLADATIALESATTEVEQLSAAASQADAEQIIALETNARGVVERLTANVADRRESLIRLQAKIDALGERGLADARDTAATSLTSLGSRRDRLDLRSDAARLLYETFLERRSEARSRYVEPLRDAITRLGRLVFGSDLEIELGDDLAVSSRTLSGSTLDFDQLSTGAREQIGILGRLACATLVDADEGVPVIFDDALGWTDSARLKSMGAAISVAGRHCQIIVLTCMTDRYASVGDAAVIRLPASR